MNSHLRHFKLGELLKIKHGYPFLGVYFTTSGDYIVLTPGNFIEEGGFKRTLGKEKYYVTNFPKEYLCNQGDLIIAMTEQAEGLLGSTAIVPESNLYLHNQRIGLVSNDITKIDKIYLYYLFMTKSVRKQISNTASGTKVKHTSPEKIYDVSVYIPSMKIQIDNSRLLWKIDQKIQVNNLIIEKLEMLSKSIYDFWFVQFDFPDADGKPYRASGGEMEYNDRLKKEIPKGWQVKFVKEILNVITGKEDANFATDDGAYMFFTCSQETLLCDTPAFEGSAVLIAGNGDFNVKHYSGKFNAYQRTYVLLPEQRYYNLLFMAVRDRISHFKNSSNGSIVKFITKSDVENIPLVIPDKKLELEEINKYIYKIEQYERENFELRKLRNWLLPILMNGRATVE